MTKIKKPLETAMEEKKVKQTKNVKKLIKVSREGQPDPKPLSKGEKERVRKQKPFAGGGRATRGYGKAYMKGGKVK